ncbi:hypothetical protein [Mesorhizobium sp. B2-8-3]|uniref:hypothetical protein n=1 Tax=Mesorhizobium sp. B2-8-3 TaxID=2589905 RepID=UPI001128CD40|nr:hypothetical protein [Mesorhizobium sp. B2-8-3]TPJ37169.1 hypothetical protein FJ418_02695 [Mesorhizobium sp. B2-8-3]
MPINSQAFDFDKAVAELPILRGFIDFVNAQVGVYMDCLSGFQGNTARIERQVSRQLRRDGTKIEDGQEVVMFASFEDPSRPEVIHHRIIAAENFLSSNSASGFNHQQICWSIIVFVFAYWDEEIRPQIAKVRGVNPDEVKLDAMGDFRILRNSVIHNKGIISAVDYAKLKVMGDMVKAGEPVTISYDHMHRVFVLIKQAIAELMLHYTGHLPGAPKASELRGIAIQ